MTINLRPGEFSKVAFCEETPAYKSSRWNQTRVFRLGFLVGVGWGAQRIAKDPLINSHTGNVHRQVTRFGGHFRDADGMGVTLTAEAANYFDKAAFKRGISREKLIQVLLLEMHG